MKKTLFYLALAATLTLGFSACSSDDNNVPPVPEYLDIDNLPQYAKDAASYILNTQLPSSDGNASLKKVSFTEAGRMLFEVEIDGDSECALYEAEYKDGVYTIYKDGIKIGTVTDSELLGKSKSSSTSINIDVTITIDGNNYTFNTGSPVSAQYVKETMDDIYLNSIARSWTVKSMLITLNGDVNLSMLERSGNLKVFADEAQKRGADMTEKEMEDLNKTVKGFTIDKNGNLVVEYINNSDNLSDDELATWTWNAGSHHDFEIDYNNTDFGNKYIPTGTVIKAEYNNAGGCTFTINTKITGNKEYDATLTVVLGDASKK